MYCSRRRLLGLLLAVFALGSCRKSAGPQGTEKIAVLRFENLSPDVSLSWAGRAFSEVIAVELGRVPGMQALTATRLHAYDRILGPRPISAPGISTERESAMAAGASQIVYGEYTERNGKLEAKATIEDPRTLHVVRTISVSVPAGDVLAAATALAREINPKAGAYGTRNQSALTAYVQALETADAGQMQRLAQSALQADSDFGPAYRLLSGALAQRGDAAGAMTVIEQALERRDRLDPLERARLELQAAELSGDSAARQAALNEVVKFEPADMIAWRTLGDVALNRHDYRHAVESYQKATQLDPTDLATWNSLGYAATYAGDLQTGTAALRRYQALSPAGANPLDSLGDIHLASGKLAEAEQFYLEASKKDPNFFGQGPVLKAAVARLLTGDVAGANSLADQYFKAHDLAKDPTTGFRQAQWMWLVGMRKEAYQRMQALAASSESTLRDGASGAYAELALWTLMMGDRPAAQQLAAKSASLAGPAARGNAIVTAFLAQPPASASEWTVRAEQQFGGPGQTNIKNFALAYALLINREFQAAQLLFKQMWESGSPVADEGLPLMLAWCYLENGKPKEAAPLLRFNPVPNTAGLTPYVPFYLPRLFYLRGVLAEKEGRTGDAATEFKKFLALSGNVPLMWGEEQKARQQ